MDTAYRIYRMPCEDEGMGLGNASTSQGTQKIADKLLEGR